MKKARKGFTLVELLIVVAILATLTASMTTSISGSSGKAKAAVIANNVEAMKTAASQYYAANMDDSTALNVSTTTMLNAYVPTWGDFGSGKITYTADDTTATREGWAVTVDFSGDGDVDEIKEALGKIKGYGSYGAKKGGDGTDKDDPDPTKTRVKDGAFKVTLWNGAIAAVTPNP